MNINKVTISGADNLVSKDEMLYTQQAFPFVEWGILVSTKRMGTARYPTLEWIKNLHPELNISFHLCGDICRDFVNGGGEWFRLSRKNDIRNYSRLQLNFSFKEDKDWIENLVDLASIAVAIHRDEKSLILAYNKGSKKNLDAFIEGIPSAPHNIHYLYDSSGGRGTQITSFKKPLINYTGYAGGINPENVFDICDTLSNMEWEQDIWIDMETGVRTNDKFDMQKVNDVLAICSKFVNQKP